MSVTFGFYNSINKDRQYNSAQMSSLFDGIINDGVFASIGVSLVVEAGTGMGVIVGEGRAWFNHTWTNNDAELPLTVTAAEMTLNRIDAVVVEVDSSDATRANSIKIVKGLPASIPVNPIMTDTEYVHQYPLAYIYVAAGVTAITGLNITNAVGTAACPFITGLLQTMTVDGITNILTAEFEDWFAGVQGTLSGDVAGNLVLMMNDKVNISDKATEEEASAGVNDTKWMSPSKVMSAMDGAIKPGDRVTEISKMSSGRYIPCDGARIDEIYRDTLRGSIAAHEFSAFSGYGGASAAGNKATTPSNIVLMAANNSMFIVAAGVASQYSPNTSPSNASIADYFTITSTPDPDNVAFTTRLHANGEVLFGVGYDEVTSKFWVASLYTAAAGQYYIRVRYSTDGITWSVVTATMFTNVSSLNCGLLNPEACGGRLVFFQNGLNSSPGVVFNLNTLLFTTFAWPVAVAASPSLPYISPDGLHIGFYYNNITYTSSNCGTSWASTSAIPYYSHICYTSACGWVIRYLSSLYNAPEGGGTWTIVAAVSPTSYAHQQSDGRVYVFVRSDGVNAPSYILTSINGTTWSTILTTTIFKITHGFNDAFWAGAGPEPLMLEMNSKLFFGVVTEAQSGLWRFALLDGVSVITTSTITLDVAFGGSYGVKSATYDKISGIIHLLLGTTASASYYPNGNTFTFVSINVINNKIITEESWVSETYNFPGYKVPYTGTALTSSRFSPQALNYVGFAQPINGNGNGIYINNQSIAINYKGDWKAFSSTILGDTTVGKYIKFYICGSSLCTKPREGMFLCLEGG